MPPLKQRITKKENKMKKIKLLLVDDEEDFVKTLSQRMEKRDQESNIALSGEQALKLIDDDEPDVMVLDLKMPGIDGMEVLRRVKKAYPDVQVIILTGHGSEKIEEEARRLGAFEYLKKPTKIDTIMSKIKLAFKEKTERFRDGSYFHDKWASHSEWIERREGKHKD
jgi:DNA-binding NtrC family response regulator